MKRALVLISSLTLTHRSRFLLELTIKAPDINSWYLVGLMETEENKPALKA